MQEKYPIEIIKRKVTSRIEYKMRWNTGSITYEPMVELTP
jgi:lysyl-tRNA synthetase class I